MKMEKLTIVEKSILQKSEQPMLNNDQLNFLLQRTPQAHVYERPAKGGGKWKFVTGTYVKKVLNSIFGWDWDFEVVTFDINHQAKQCIVHGKLTCRVNDRAILKTQFGRADIKYRKNTEQPLDLGNDLKAACTDALKKCASEIGVASDIFGGEEFKAIKVVDDDYADVPPEAWKQLKKVDSLDSLEMLRDAWDEELSKNESWNKALAKTNRTLKFK